MITISELLRIVLKGLPPTVNHMYRTGRNGIRYKRMEVEEWQEEVSGIIREAWGEKPPYEGNVEVRVLFMVKDNRRWDIDNRLKGVCQVNCVLDFSYATLGNLSAYLT